MNNLKCWLCHKNYCISQGHLKVNECKKHWVGGFGGFGDQCTTIQPIGIYQRISVNLVQPVSLF